MQTDDPVYSYGRFSDSPQDLGDSFRRQDDGADRWAKRNGKVIADHRKLFDKAASGYHGVHRSDPDRWALARFLAAVSENDVPRGSYLVIENLDRLTREKPVIGLTLLLNLIVNGIRVVVLTPVEITYDVDANGMQLMMALMELVRGHGESGRKSETISEQWAEKRKKARKGEEIGGNLPAWLGRRKRDGKVLPVKTRTAAIRRIFELACEGEGALRICRALVAEGHEPFGKMNKKLGKRVWAANSIRKILTDRRVLGEHVFLTGPNKTPDGPVMPRYYPRVISDEVFAVAGRERRKHAKVKSRDRKHLNTFAGMLTSALDGTSMLLFVGANGMVYDSYAGRRGSEKSRSFPREVFEEALLRELREISTADLKTPDPADTLKRLDDERIEATKELADLEEELKQGTSKTLMAGVRHWEGRLKAAEEGIKEETAKAAKPAVKAWGECRSLAAEWRDAQDRDAVRLRIRSALRRVGCSGHVLITGHGKTRIAAVQLRFVEPAITRSFAILYKAAGNGRKAAAWVNSDIDPTGSLDLSKREDAEALEQGLRRLDWATVAEKLTPLDGAA